MLYSRFRNSIIIVRKIKPIAILSFSTNTTIKCLPCSKSTTIQKTKFIKRDFHKHVKNCNAIKFKSKEEQDMIDNEKLQKLVEDSNNERTYKLLKYEIEYMKQLNDQVPQNIRPSDWIFLLNTPSKSQRRKYLKFLFINEMKEQNLKRKKKALVEESLKQWQEKQESFTSGLTYGLSNNSLFMRIYDTTMDKFYNYNLMLSMIFEPKIVFDCGYEENMTRLELNNCAKQMLFSFVMNRTHKSPAHLYLCNAFKDNKLMMQLHRLIPSLYDDSFPLDQTPKSYLDIFDKDKLIYLTPHCRTPMVSYNPDKIYIIGAMVDKTNPKPYSLAKAKKEGLRMEKFPLDTYLNWSSGSGKSLTINQALSILLDMKLEKDWASVLRKNIPARKILKDEGRRIIIKK